jgi:hypothetical protein
MTATLDDAVLDEALLDNELVRGIVAQVADREDYAAFQATGRRCRWCAEPVRLIGKSATVDTDTGEILESFSSAESPRGELYKACGTRRASRCPSCAEIYKGDARQLVVSGLTGGKGTPETVASRPMVFATLTAPSFGTVHRRPGAGGPCGARGPRRCAHGRPVSCLAHHDANDQLLGEAICADCYDYEQAVLFNAHLSELWRRTTIYSRRHLARLVGVTDRALDQTIRLSYIKVAEFQRRGVVHLHVLCRLDGADGEEPPAQFTTALLSLALRIAVHQVRAPYPDGRGEARWGEQFDCRALPPGVPAETVRIANYLAKYATKGSDQDGALDRRLRGLEDLKGRALAPQLRKMAAVAWRLGGEPALSGLRLRNWAHTLGLRSHFLTKSRRFSTTFKALRIARQDHRRAERFERAGISLPVATELVVLSEWTYLGRGWKSRAERYLAGCEARSAEEARRDAREATYAEQAA